MLPLWDSQPHRRRIFVTPCVLAGLVAVFACEALLLFSDRAALETAIQRHAVVADRLVAGWDDPRQWLTVFSALFLHGSVTHLVGNAWFLWVFGRSVESAIGPWRFTLLYIGAGLAGTAAQVATNPGATAPLLGASGAISGLMGAYFALFPRAWIIALVPWVVPVLPVPAVLFLVLWFLLQTLNGIGVLMAGNPAGAGVAWWAHFGGFVAGLALVRRGARRRRAR